jgi:3'-phosphoadenosine 5'-phosphosulfate sulfotransferase (PAPS reductase)/FAD synthetase
MSWQSWLDTWEIHATSSTFRRRLRESIAHVQQAHEQEPRMFAGLSGGKDGCALAGVLKLAGVRVELVHVHTDLNTPGMEECAYTTAEKLDMFLEVIEPDWAPHSSIWEWLRHQPQAATIAEVLPALARKSAVGNMLVAHTYARGFRGAYSGMRNEESKGRRMNYAVRGCLYQLTKDSCWMCNPLATWKARDAFAMLIHMGLPVHPHYRLAYDQFDVSPESPMSRVDCLLTSEAIAARGATEQMRVFYPEVYRQLAAVRPEIAREL